MRLPLPFHPHRRPVRRAERFAEADAVLAHLEDAVRQFDVVLDGLIEVLQSPRNGRR